MDIAEIYGEEYTEPEECRELTDDEVNEIIGA